MKPPAHPRLGESQEWAAVTATSSQGQCFTFLPLFWWNKKKSQFICLCSSSRCWSEPQHYFGGPVQIFQYISHKYLLSHTQKAISSAFVTCSSRICFFWIDVTENSAWHKFVKSGRPVTGAFCQMPLFYPLIRYFDFNSYKMLPYLGMQIFLLIVEHDLL